MLAFDRKPSIDLKKNGELRFFFHQRKYSFVTNVDLNRWYNISIEQKGNNRKVSFKKSEVQFRPTVKIICLWPSLFPLAYQYVYDRFFSLLQSMEERFTVLRILIRRHLRMLECLLETNISQPPMPATEIYYGRIFMLTTALISGLKHRTRRLEQLTDGVHSTVSVLIWSFTHFNI